MMQHVTSTRVVLVAVPHVANCVESSPQYPPIAGGAGGGAGGAGPFFL